MFGTTDKFLKRFQISSLDELPDYEELINRIQLIHGNDDDNDYLYKKDVYVDTETVGEVEPADSEAAVTVSDESDNGGGSAASEKTSEKILKKIKRKAAANAENDDFELPDISEEEIPDFLKGEDVEKI